MLATVWQLENPTFVHDEGRGLCRFTDGRYAFTRYYVPTVSCSRQRSSERPFETTVYKGCAAIGLGANARHRFKVVLAPPISEA